jgi:hypothetical protein
MLKNMLYLQQGRQAGRQALAEMSHFILFNKTEQCSLI